MYSHKNIYGVVSQSPKIPHKNTSLKSGGNKASLTVKVYDGLDSAEVKGPNNYEWIKLNNVPDKYLTGVKSGTEVKLSIQKAQNSMEWQLSGLAVLKSKKHEKFKSDFLSMKIPNCSVKDLNNIYNAFGYDVLTCARNRVGLMVNNKNEFSYPLKSVVSVSSNVERIDASIRAMGALTEAGFTPPEIGLLSKVYGLNLGGMVKDNPYGLLVNNAIVGGGQFLFNAESVSRAMVGKLDKLVSNLAMPATDQLAYQKLYYSVDMIIRRLGSSGSTVFSKHNVIEDLSKVIDGGYKEAENAVNQIIDVGVYKMLNAGTEGYFIAPTKNYRIEEDIVKLIVKRCKVADIDVLPRDLIFEDFYTDEQRQAIKLSVQKNILVVTGGAGTGKTTVIKGITQNIKKHFGSDAKILLCSPTGRAAQRISEQTMLEAKTIHSILKFNPEKGFLVPDIPDDLDVLVVDESSMMDSQLFYRLINSLPLDTKLVLVGDIKQLCSINPGQPFRDMLLSELLPSVTLSVPQRTKGLSHIYQNANKVINGVMPDLVDNDDYHFTKTNSDEETQKEILRILSEDIESKYGSTLDKVQVMAPKRQPSGFVGITPLNTEIQRLLNEHAPKKGGSGKEIFVGDKVVFKKNDYKLKLFNGDIGVVDRIADNGNIILKSQGKDFEIPKAKSNLLELAYTLSIHKMQGSESDIVIMPLSKNHSHMLSPESIYTAITRAKKHFFFVGDPDVISEALKNVHLNKRDTYMKTRLVQLKNQYGVGLTQLGGSELPEESDNKIKVGSHESTHKGVDSAPELSTEGLVRDPIGIKQVEVEEHEWNFDF